MIRRKDRSHLHNIACQFQAWLQPQQHWIRQCLNEVEQPGEMPDEMAGMDKTNEQLVIIRAKVLSLQ